MGELTQNRFVMQDHKDPQSFTIVERYEHEDSQKYHSPVHLSSVLRKVY